MSKTKSISPRPAAKSETHGSKESATSSYKGALAPGYIQHKPHDMTLAVASPSGALVVDEADQDALMGAQLTAQWEVVKSGTKQQLIFGAMMLKVWERCDSARGAAKLGNEARKGKGLKGWLAEHAPSVGEGSAYRMMEVAEGLHADLKLGKGVDLEELLATQLEDLPEKLAAKRAQIDKVIDGKSQRQLLLEFGKSMKRKGGKTSKKNDEEEDEDKKPADWTDEQWERFLKLSPEQQEAVLIARPTLNKLHDLADPEHSCLPFLPGAERKELEHALRKISELLASVKGAK